MISKYKNEKILYFFFILFVLCHFYSFGNQIVKKALNDIPQSDREVLEKFFQSLFNRGNFSYTLFGDKPMSLTCYLMTPFYDDGMPASQGECRFKRGWETWKKYSSLFPMKNYVLIENPTDHDQHKDIVFINKKWFKEKVRAHLRLFQNIMREEMTETTLLKKIEENPRVLAFFNHHPLLLGILLGYGKHNAQLYTNRDKLSDFVYRKHVPKIPVKIPLPSQPFASLEEEFNSYFSVLTLFGDPAYSPLIIQSVHFVADHQHPETIALEKKYRKMRKKISKIYSNGNFLEITLSKLTENE